MNPALLAELERRHAEPHRHHHTWPRITAMLATAGEIAHAVAERPPFILAILFHTAIFDRTRPDTAAQSVALMRRLTAAPEPLLARAAALILAVARQELPETDDPSLRGDAMLLLDMDATPLALPPDDHAAYEAALRAESPHLSEDRYAIGRAAALRVMLWRERIFRTDRFFLAHEKPARRNAEAWLARLEG